MILDRIIIIILPIIAYIIVWVWTSQLIKIKIIDKENRKKYKKFFYKRLGLIFQPIFVLSFILLAALYPEKNAMLVFGGIGIFFFVLKIVIMLMQGTISFFLFKGVQINIKNLRTETEENILKDIEEL
jgi:hypothetical protein